MDRYGHGFAERRPRIKKRRNEETNPQDKTNQTKLSLSSIRRELSPALCASEARCQFRWKRAKFKWSCKSRLICPIKSPPVGKNPGCGCPSCFGRRGGGRLSRRTPDAAAGRRDARLGLLADGSVF